MAQICNIHLHRPFGITSENSSTFSEDRLEVFTSHACAHGYNTVQRFLYELAIFKLDLHCFDYSTTTVILATNDYAFRVSLLVTMAMTMALIFTTTASATSRIAVPFAIPITAAIVTFYDKHCACDAYN